MTVVLFLIPLVAAAITAAFVVRRRRRLAAPADESDVLPEPTDVLGVKMREGDLVPYKCGHTAHERFTLDFYGIEAAPTDERLAERADCPDCEIERVRRTSIRCALCGHVILPGEPVALYVDDRKLFKKEAWKTLADGHVVGCMRWDCCPSGGFFSGHWTPQGFRPAFAHGSAVAEVFATGKAIIVGDSSDPSTIKTIDDEKEIP